MNPKKMSFVLAAFAIFLLPIFIAGCQDSLRFAPSESQKQSAELTHTLAAKINAEGTEPGSPASQRLKEGTQAAVVYMGRPARPPSAEDFDTVAEQANQDAAERPDAWSVADNVFELAIGVSALLGGVYGTRAVRCLKQAREKSQALKEIIEGNELFKGKVQSAAGTAKSAEEVLTDFKESQNTSQNVSTRRIIAETKIGS